VFDLPRLPAIFFRTRYRLRQTQLAIDLANQQQTRIAGHRTAVERRFDATRSATRKASPSDRAFDLPLPLQFVIGHLVFVDEASHLYQRLEHLVGRPQFKKNAG
jgi:hypothetical protein